MNIMVTGAAGEYGHAALNYLTQMAPNDQLFGLIHNDKKKSLFDDSDIQIRVADYSDYDAMVKALTGIDRLLFVSVSIPKVQKTVVAAAKAAGVKFIAYTSIADPQYEKFGLQINHSQTERWIKESGIPHTFLRNNWYLEIISDYLKASATHHYFPFFADQGVAAWALKREYAEAGARVITRSDNPEIITLAGNPVSFREMGEAVQEAVGQNVQIDHVSADKFADEAAKIDLSQGAAMLAASYQDYVIKQQNGEADLTATEFEKVLGHPLVSLPEAIKTLL
ncbi:NAD(P)H-binding protein [Secundilactobacillus folii]|uniref:NAD(P)H-binding protein n=1 Tax=Secundilactobacillus folii TaxID=2678357 RepID=A0A7X2XVE3_9LACO|nr:NAD(P)H-binding protein [Secundilactobacillus folii]MTV82250.1 NAD(P)H-binding protein [Secundilactobacillus folii]